MRFGPTSLKLPSVLAKGLHRPKLRSDLRISEQHVAGETSYIVKIFEISSYNRYGAFEYELLTLFDGSANLAPRRAPADDQQIAGLGADDFERQLVGESFELRGPDGDHAFVIDRIDAGGAGVYNAGAGFSYGVRVYAGGNPRA